MKTQWHLVTGASSGIGKAIAVQLANSDSQHRLFLLGRNEERLREVRSELPNSNEHRMIAVDLSDRHSVRSSLKKAHLEDFNLVSVIANAGVGGENRYGELDRWDEIIETNLTGTYRLIQEALPALRNSQNLYRHVIITSSILARIGVPHYSAYCASKAGLLGLTRSLAAELAPERILVNAICPGWVDTQMSSDGLNLMAQGSGQSIDEIRAREMSRIPLGKMSQPEEIASLVHFLVSSRQCSITGQAIDINNGAWMI
jgi:NAD(P)-dependent dehydrogenase (short-subunit alcohol dehydrogenase family)